MPGLRATCSLGTCPPATHRSGDPGAICPTATSNTRGASTTRRRSAASGSSWARSRRCWRSIRASVRRSCWPGRTLPATSASWPTACPTAAAIPALSELRDFLAKLPDCYGARRLCHARRPPADRMARSTARRSRTRRGPAGRRNGLRRPTEAEAQLAAIWAQVLGVLQVGIRDSYSELGGESILSLQIIASQEGGHRVQPAPALRTPHRREGCWPRLQGARDVVVEQGSSPARRR